MALQFWLRLLDGAVRVRGIRRRRVRTPNGFELSYLEYGRRREGPAVVLVHGLATSSLSWVRVLRRLGKHHRVFALDLPGFGDSPFLPGRDHTEIHELADAVVGFLDAGVTPDKVVLVGSSLGGWVSAKAARKRPDRLRQLVLVNSAGVYHPNIDEVRRRLHVETREHVKEFWEHMWHKVPFYYLFFWKDYIGHMKQPNVTKFLDSITKEDDFINKDLRALQVPTTIVWGTSDRFLPMETVDVMIRELPFVQVYWMPKTGHIPHLERPSGFAQILLGVMRRDESHAPQGPSNSRPARPRA